MANILVIDDDEVMLKIATEILKAADFSVFTATNGYDGLEIVNNNEIHLLVCDVNLPAVSGFQILDTLRNSERHRLLPVMLLTGRSDKRDILRGVKSGADDYMVKPMQKDVLTAKVEALMEKKYGKDFRRCK